MTFHCAVCYYLEMYACCVISPKYCSVLGTCEINFQYKDIAPQTRLCYNFKG